LSERCSARERRFDEIGKRFSAGAEKQALKSDSRTPDDDV
jgi:hypothetical protein